jgi:hypothetical protein
MIGVGATSVPRSRRRLRAALVVALALTTARAARAAPGPLVLLPASGRGVSAPLVQHARWMLLQGLSARLGTLIVDYDRPPIAERLEPWRLASIAGSVGGNLAVAIDVSRDAGVTTVDVACFDVRTAGVVCRVRGSTAAGPETLAGVTDAVAARVSQTLGGPREATPPPSARRPHGFRLGARALVAVPTVTTAGGALAMGGIGLLVTANLPGAFVDLDGDFVAGNGWNMISAGLGYFALLAEGRRAPYLGGSARWVDQDLGGRGASGAQLRPTLGFAWGRDELVQTRLELAYFVNLYQERTVDRLIVGSDASYLSHGPLVSFGAAF